MRKLKINPFNLKHSYVNILDRIKYLLENIKHIQLHEMLWILLELMITLIFAFLFGLPWHYAFSLFLFSVFITPWFITYQVQWHAEEKSFFMLTDFLQQLIATFKQHPKIFASLNECRDITYGRLQVDVDVWISGLERGMNPKEQAQIFLQKWPHFIVGNLIHLMLAVENYGTFNYAEGLEIIQDDIEDWLEDTYLFKQQQVSTRFRIQLLSLVSLGIAWISHRMLFKTEIIETLDFYSFSLFIFMILILLTLFFAQKSISGAWIEPREMIWRKESS